MLKKNNILSLVLQLICISIYAQKITPAWYEANFVNYSSEQGLDGMNGFRSYEDSKGYLWFCAKEGLSRFDGITFQNYTINDGLPSQIVTSACEDNNGNVWIGTVNGFAIFKNKRFDTTLHLKKYKILNIIKATDGTFWAATSSGLVHINPSNTQKPLLKEYKIYEYVENTLFRNVWQNKKGEIMGGSESGCFIIKNDSLVRYNNLPGPVYTMLEFNDGTEWFTGWDRPISVYKNGILKKEIKLGSFALDMLRDAKGNIWIATWDKGIFKFNGEDFINYSTQEGLTFNSFWGINEDSRGNLWLSSWGSGLFKYSGECFTRISEKSGLPSNIITSVLETSPYQLWISSEQSISSYNLKTGKLKNYTQCNNQKLSLIISLYKNQPNQIWALGYIGQGYKITDGIISANKDLTGFTAIKDSKGNTWIGTDKNGAVKISGNNKTSISITNTQSNNRVISIYEDKKHNYWFINDYKGIHLYKNDTVQNFNRSNGFVNEPASTMSEDSKGFYWICVPTKGVYKCTLDNTNHFKIIDSLTAINGLISNNVNSIAIVNNKLYMGTKHGLCVMDFDLYNKGQKKLTYYTKEDGLLNINCSINSIDSRGNLWLSTSGGAFMFNASNSKLNAKESRTYITQINLFFKEVNWLKYAAKVSSDGLPIQLKLPYEKNHLTFKFIGINLTAPNKVLYRYKLEGLDKDWSPEVTKNEADYSSIPAGTYTFMVKSCNNDGLWNKNAQRFVFTITPPFWKTIEFYIICGIILLIFFYFIVKLREKKLHREKIVLEQTVTQRTSQLKKAFEQISIKNKEITDSINYASKIQDAILPSKKSIRIPENNFFILFKPKDIVSGDFYWSANHIDEKGNEYLFLAICDSTGHGVPGAFMSLLNIGFLSEAIKEKNILEPNMIFNYVRKRLIESISSEEQKDGFDGILIRINNKELTQKKDTIKIEYAAANNAPILISNTKSIELLKDKMPVGKGERQEDFSLYSTEIKFGDAIYLYTDGYADQFGGKKGKKFKYKALNELLLQIHQQPMQTQEVALLNAFNNWKGDLEQVDDVCVVGLRLL